MDLNLATAHEAIAAAIPDRECIVFRDKRLTWAEVTGRTRRLANALLARGLGKVVERAHLAGHESGQDHLAIYLYNGNEYLEAMLGAFKARVAPFNVNYRYVAEELRYLLADADAKAIVYQSAFAPTLAEVLDSLPNLTVLIQVADESGNDLLPGAEWYEDVLAASSADATGVTPSPDDLYILYTGGTTGMPKGVLWRQADIFVEALGGRRNDGAPFEDYESLVAGATGVEGGLRAVLAPPFMHGAGHWMSFLTFHRGGTVFIQSNPERLDAEDIWSLIAREKVAFLLIVGDAFARPLLDELDRNSYDLSSLTVLLSGGAPLSAPLKQEFLKHLPALIVVDGLGSSEAGGQMQHVSAGGAASTGTFVLSPGNHVLSADLTHELGEGDDEIGWLAKSGRLALGYLGDAEKTARTYPVVDGVRYAVPGDRARLCPGNIVELHGRDSVTINSGGEKIFAEEVEHALRHHPAVYDVVVAPRPSDRWGQEVVAIVRLREGVDASDALEAELLDESEKHIARYKLPKAFVFVDEVVRSPSGKADYRWARTTATDA
ncbi:MAG TPA: acyl-CoA synthetase [Acidimicrobiales bacterium]|nr:acyl-CoA synthetase [Acidimicrobiales bacterium]